jgi:hypothetical protein
MPSDSGECIYIVYALTFCEDGTGSYVFWNIDNRGTFSGKFEFEPHADFEVRVRLIETESGPDPEILIRYRFAVRRDQYGTNILCARFTPAEPYAPNFWLLPEEEWLDGPSDFYPAYSRTDPRRD